MDINTSLFMLAEAASDETTQVQDMEQWNSSPSTDFSLLLASCPIIAMRCMQPGATAVMTPLFGNDSGTSMAYPPLQRQSCSVLTPPNLLFSQAAASAVGAVVRFPCRARNTCADHNSLTAYFCVPINNAMHGIELICSHPKCRIEGVKFRFCAHCR